MKPIIPNLQPGLQIGDYVLGSQIQSAADQQVWLGEQVSVKREVEIVCYFGSNPEEFLADIRVKAMVEDGVLGLVYEAVPTEDFIAFAREVLPQKSLASIVADRQHLLPVEVTRIIAQIAATFHSLENRKIAREDFDGQDIRLTPQNVVRIVNIAKAGTPQNDQTSRQALSKALNGLLKTGEPGATRMGTLIAYIKGTSTQEAIPWKQVEKLAKQVDEQLSEAKIPPPRSTPILENKRSARGVMIAGLILGLIAAIIGVIVLQKDEPTFEVGQTVTISAGRYLRPNGGLVELKAFRIHAAEVTIDEYNEFMEAWQMLSASDREKLWPSNRPDDKITVRPAEWNSYFPKARAQQTWKGRNISLDCPVFGVDWWDAQAFAKWKKGRLPTEQEWWAASSSVKNASKTDNDWRPVGGPEQEKVYGLNGNVAEWAANSSKNPAFPIDSAKPVALGGSFSKPSKDALYREWLDSRSIRRDNLGFRVVYPEQQ